MKKVVTVVVVAVCMALLFAGCGNTAQTQQETQGTQETQSSQQAQNTQETEYIGILSAMDNEIALLLEHADIDHVDRIGGIDYHVGTLNGQNVVICRSGIGKIYASAGLSAMVNRYPISKVIFTGIAGGVGDETKVLDEVIATKVVQHDYGIYTNEGFEWTDGNTGEEVGKDGFFYCDPNLVELAYDAAVQVLGEGHVFKGTIATGDQFIASEDYVEYLQNSFDAIACEMEGASVAAVCELYNTPFVVVRAMSDKADGLAKESFDNMADIAADNSSQIVLLILENMDK